jgi:hypothetical protein
VTELRLVASGTVAASDDRPLVWRTAQLFAGNTGIAQAAIEDGHGMPILTLRAGPDEPSSATARWRADDRSGRRITGFGVHLSGQGAVLLVDLEPSPDPARDPAVLVIDETRPPPERDYRSSHELTDIAALRRPRTQI